MSSENKSATVQIIVAIIGLVGVLGAAMITIWPQINPNLPEMNDENGSGIPWQQQKSYEGDCRARPEGTVCVSYDDGYVWLVNGAIRSWDERVEDDRRVQVAVSRTGRYEHILGTSKVRKIE